MRQTVKDLSLPVGDTQRDFRLHKLDAFSGGIPEPPAGLSSGRSAEYRSPPRAACTDMLT